MPDTALDPRTGITAFQNRTQLDTDRLRRQCLDAVQGWRLGGLQVSIRYSRGADFSGTCYYRPPRIYVNLGRHLSYPYAMGTHLARARSYPTYWVRPVYRILLPDAFAVVLFIFLHEVYHLLVKRARRNTRQKEAMCDRFAARVLVDRYGAIVLDEDGGEVNRDEWDFQDLTGFVAAAARRDSSAKAARRPRTRSGSDRTSGQLLLFDL